MLHLTGLLGQNRVLSIFSVLPLKRQSLHPRQLFYPEQRPSRLLQSPRACWSFSWWHVQGLPACPCSGHPETELSLLPLILDQYAKIFRPALRDWVFYIWGNLGIGTEGEIPLTGIRRLQYRALHLHWLLSAPFAISRENKALLGCLLVNTTLCVGDTYIWPNESYLKWQREARISYTLSRLTISLSVCFIHRF